MHFDQTTKSRSIANKLYIVKAKVMSQEKGTKEFPWEVRDVRTDIVRETWIG